MRLHCTFARNSNTINTVTQPYRHTYSNTEVVSRRQSVASLFNGVENKLMIPTLLPGLKHEAEFKEYLQNIVSVVLVFTASSSTGFAQLNEEFYIQSCLSFSRNSLTAYS